ncbi:DUF1801 domain-containing protein [Desulfitobacterium sp. Sab5]|uniref:DUF1801 domain-containing protein n=1 Tax=Desulfitobacterium nosdiversum TaxID=3375356 RepID=UPI003CF2D8CF
MERDPCVVSRRDDMYRGDLQERREMTFAKGASLKDPSHIFNSSLDGNARRAIDFHEGDEVDEEALKELIRAAVALNNTLPPRPLQAPWASFLYPQGTLST